MSRNGEQTICISTLPLRPLDHKRGSLARLGSCPSDLPKDEPAPQTGKADGIIVLQGVEVHVAPPDHQRREHSPDDCPGAAVAPRQPGWSGAVGLADSHLAHLMRAQERAKIAQNA